METTNHLSVEVGDHQIAWDSTSLTLFKTCPRLYELQILRGWRSRHQSPHLDFGLMYHKLLELHEKYLFAGESYQSATEHIVADWAKMAENFNPEHMKNRESLLRTVLWYLFQHEHDTIKTYRLADGKPALELSFRFDIDFQSKLTGEDYIFCGHLDRIGYIPSGDLYIIDRKTTTSTIAPYYFKKYQLNNQISFYAVAGSIVLSQRIHGTIIEAAQVAVNFSRFDRAFIPRSPAQLAEWFEDTKRYLRLAETYASQKYWPMNDTACDKFGGCQYCGICGSDPVVREAFLKASFVQNFWRPLESRDD